MYTALFFDLVHSAAILQPYSSLKNPVEAITNAIHGSEIDGIYLADKKTILSYGKVTITVGSKEPRIQTFGHSLVLSLIRSHRTLIRLLRTACLLACSTALTHSILGSWESE